MQTFRWLSAGRVPAAFDLRRLGWRMADGTAGSGDDVLRPLLVVPAGLCMARWLELVSAPRERMARTVVLGIDDPHARARMLRMGFGDALGWGTAIAELEVRVLRVLDCAGMVPAVRQIGALRLDLIAREACVAGRALGLHPREFALLWRLADTPGAAVDPRDLLRDVWRLSFRPETNSLAVHVSRLRAKLRLAGLDGLVETRPDGSYRLAIAAPGCNLPLDGRFRLGEEQGGEDLREVRQEPDPCAMK